MKAACTESIHQARILLSFPISQPQLNRSEFPHHSVAHRISYPSTSYLDKSTMKAFGIFTIIALTALINGSSALWCECNQKDRFGHTKNWGGSLDCCENVMGTGLMDGFSFFGLSPKDWCDTSGNKVEQYKKCCDENDMHGYCK